MCFVAERRAIKPTCWRGSRPSATPVTDRAVCDFLKAAAFTDNVADLQMFVSGSFIPRDLALSGTSCPTPLNSFPREVPSKLSH
jgi:hypothetical protein